jgi:hypothetical protein
MSDDLESRRRARSESGVRRAKNGAALPSSRDDLPGWVTVFFIPATACDACARHWHHKCWGVDVLLDPIPDCPCDCGDRKDPMRLSPEAWADLALHCPEVVPEAVQSQRIRDGIGVYLCVTDDEERTRAFKERR